MTSAASGMTQIDVGRPATGDANTKICQPGAVSRPVKVVGLGPGAGVGVLVPLLGYVLLMTMHLVVSDVALVALLVVPVAFCALLFAIPAVRPHALGMLAGALIGVAILVGVVLGGVGLVAWLLSD